MGIPNKCLGKCGLKNFGKGIPSSSRGSADSTSLVASGLDNEDASVSCRKKYNDFPSELFSGEAIFICKQSLNVKISYETAALIFSFANKKQVIHVIYPFATQLNLIETSINYSGLVYCSQSTTISVCRPWPFSLSRINLGSLQVTCYSA